MKQRELIAPIWIKEGKAKRGFSEDAELIEDPLDLALDLENNGADALLIFDLSNGDEDHDQCISLIRKISQKTDLPLYGGGNIRRLEDVKKLIYAGCKKVFLNFSKEGNREMLPEASARFGKERMLACAADEDALLFVFNDQLPGGILLLDTRLLEKAIKETGKRDPDQRPDLYCFTKSFDPDASFDLISKGKADGIASSDFTDPAFPFMETKDSLKEHGIAVNTFEPSFSWEDFNPDANALLPVVVQDYRTLEVLMVAYMNEESYAETIRTGKMTYFSRSRQCLWVKGETSGHFQYVKELVIDCDNDTMLAKVYQVGAACHTGNRSCFYRPILKKEFNETNPMKVFEDVYAVICDRKEHPKEGSYTNYLFDKGLDKILKKIGEEASEIIIAAKNPDPDEVVYEASDFLYHLMVLMCERGISWEDITEELAKR